jgi:hypothetical protein
LRSTDAGGRHFPILNAQNADFWLGVTDAAGRRVYESAVVYLEDEERLEPGAAGMVRLSPINADRWRGVGVGAVIEMCELSHVVGDATITEFRVGAGGSTA